MGCCLHTLQKQVRQAEEKKKAAESNQARARRMNANLESRKSMLINRRKELQDAQKKREELKRSIEDLLTLRSKIQPDLQNQLNQLQKQITLTKQNRDSLKKSINIKQQPNLKLQRLEQLKRQVERLRQSKDSLIQQRLFADRNKAKRKLKKNLSERQNLHQTSNQQLNLDDIQVEFTPIRMKKS